MREKLIELIQQAVGGCSSYWAGLIADRLLADGVAFAADNNVSCKTNADRIRGMMDEELAAFQARRNVSEACLRLKDQGYVPTEEQKEDLFNRLYGTWLKWLRQLAEEDNHAD